MTARSSVRRRVIPGAVVAALASLLILNLSAVLSATTTVDGGTWNFAASSTGNVVQVKLTGIPSAGLGAADVSVAFNSAVLKITACSAGSLDGACNPNAAAGPARAAGFKAPAITAEPAVIATLTFDCIGAAGSSSPLTITVNELVDGSPGSPQAVTATVNNGSVTCGAVPAASPTAGVLPPTGGAASGSGPGLTVVLGASLGALVAVAAAGAWILRRRAPGRGM